MNATTTLKRRPGWWYPLIYVGVFGVVLVVNFYMAYVAVHSFTGLEDDAYEKGLAYNQVLAQAKAQQGLGWSMDSALKATGAGHEQAVDVSFRDRDGRPIEGLAVKVEFSRPTKSGFDAAMALRGAGDGHYAGMASLPLPGQWEMKVVATKGDATFQMARRVVVP